MKIRLLLAAVLAALLTATLNAEMIAHYKFDGDTTDATGNGNDGTAEGDAAYAGDGTGVFGGAYSFAGVGHVVVPVDSNPAVHTDMTVTMWVKPDQSIVDSPGLYKTFGHDDGGWDRTFGLDNRQGEFRYAAFTGGAGPGPTASTGATVDSDWIFLAAVWDTDGETNGTDPLTSVRFHASDLWVTEALNNTPSVHTTSAIGNLRPDNFNEGWVGLIDDVRIFDRALSAAEIEEIRLIPEPGSLTVAGIGLLGLLGLRRRR